MPHLIAQTDYLSIVTQSVSDQFCAIADIDRFDLPFPVPQVEIALYTYRRAMPDPGVEWLRSAIREAVREWAIRHAPASAL